MIEFEDNIPCPTVVSSVILSFIHDVLSIKQNKLK